MPPGVLFKIKDKSIIVKIKDNICDNSDEFLSSKIFRRVLKEYLLKLQKRGSLKFFSHQKIDDATLDIFINTFNYLAKMPIHLISKVVNGSEELLENKESLMEFVEELYNYWRSFDRFLICSSFESEIDKYPYRTFNLTIEKLTNLVRKVYRDVQENISGTHPRIYRQVSAGAEIAAIAQPCQLKLPQQYTNLVSAIPMIRQVLIYPPLIINQLMNKRTGSFEKTENNPIDFISINEEEWICYPAKVGTLFILIYFQEKFFALGFSLCNLFELAEDDDLTRKPDAIYFFGAPQNNFKNITTFPTVFFEDVQNDLLIAACPDEDRFGYFGYLKKMVLTLHNIKAIKNGYLPFHGALLKIKIKTKKEKTVLIIGDTGAGKSEMLEALRELGEDQIEEIRIIADDMGLIQLDEQNHAIGYGSEIGAFLRLDDLKPGYAYGQLDRAIIMNPNQTNSRIILPVTFFAEIAKGHPIDMILYANNYEEIDEGHPVIEQFDSLRNALTIFKEGTVMSKGTTMTSGIVHSYFANIFGPIQYKKEHEEIADRYFKAFFKQGLFLGQIRTRLGIPGLERTGPFEAAKKLLELISG